MKIYVIMFFGQAEPKSKERVTRIRKSSLRRVPLLGLRVQGRSVCRVYQHVARALLQLQVTRKCGRHRINILMIIII